jgi:cardiolipin synthase A/B
MNYKIAVAVVAIAAVLLILRFGNFARPAPSTTVSNQPGKPPPISLPVAINNSLSLITEPDDGMAPVIAAIASASSSIDLTIYELSAGPVEQALLAAARRGVAVRVILDRGYKGVHSAENAGAYNFLHSNGILVRWSSPAFTFTHEKSMTIDGNGSDGESSDAESLIMSFNITSAAFASDRDFGIFDHAPEDVAAIEATFDDDWDAAAAGGTNSAANLGGNYGEIGSGDLVWSPGSEDELIALINSAKTSLEIYNEEMDDAAVENALEAAARRGVKVEVVMTYASTWKAAFAQLAAAGVAIRTYPARASLYIHAKMIIADGGTNAGRAFIGSENFSATSLWYNRELGIIFLNPALIASITQTFAKDWAGATPQK